MRSVTIRTEKVPCDVCGSNDSSVLYKIPDLRYWTSEQEYSVVQCVNCGHRYLNPRPVPEDIRKCYPDHYHNFRGQNISKQQARYTRQSAYFDKPPEFVQDVGPCKMVGYLVALFSVIKNAAVAQDAQMF